MYLREMGTVPLLTRAGEVEIAKRIERGQLTVLKVLSRSPVIVREIITLGDQLRRDPSIIKDILRFSDEELTEEKIEGPKPSWVPDNLVDLAVRIRDKQSERETLVPRDRRPAARSVAVVLWTILGTSPNPVNHTGASCNASTISLRRGFFEIAGCICYCCTKSVHKVCQFRQPCVRRQAIPISRLTLKQRRFIDGKLHGKSSATAARAAGYSASVARRADEIISDSRSIRRMRWWAKSAL